MNKYFWRIINDLPSNVREMRINRGSDNFGVNFAKLFDSIRESDDFGRTNERTETTFYNSGVYCPFNANIKVNSKPRWIQHRSSLP